MANKEASIKITLNNQSFVVSVKGMVDEAEKGGSKIGKALDKGFDEGKRAVKDLFSSVKSLIGLGAALGGAFSLKEGIEHAMKMEGQYRAIAREISQLTGKAVDLKQVQEDITEASKHTTVSVEALGDAFMELLKTTGDADYSSKAMREASQEATRTGKSFEALSSLAGDVNRKFGITSDKIGETLRMITANTDIGGPRLEELSGGFDQLGAVAEAGGLRGSDGFALMLGMLNKTAPVLGRFSESSRAMQGVFSALQAPEAFNKIRQMTSGSDPKFVKKLIDAPDAIARLNLILAKGGQVRKEFEKAITDRKEIALYKILTEPFDRSVADAMKAGVKGKDAMEVGSAAFKASLEGLTRSGDSKADAEKELAARMATSKAKLDQAMKELEEAFAQPEVIKAVKDLMGLMPPLVHALAKLVEFFAAHPYIGAAGIVGGTALKGAAVPLASAGAGLAGGLLKTGGKSVLSWLTGGAGVFGIGAKTAAGAAAATEGAAAAGTAGAATAGAAATGVAAVEGTALAGGATALGGGAATAGAATGAAGLGVALALPLLAAGATIAAGWQASLLHEESKSEGGIWKAVSTAIGRGGELGGKALTPEEYDKQHAAAAEVAQAAQAKQIKTAEKAADVHDILARSATAAAQSLDKLGRAANGTTSGSNTGDGVSKGPGAPSGGGPGFWDKYG